MNEDSEKILVSVIVPVYNLENYLDNCVKTIVGQTYKNIEILLIDDGSTDNSGKLCDEWGRKDSRIRAIHKKNGGVSSARNVGLKECKGDYVTFIDSDDYVKENYIEVLLNCILDNNCEMAMVSLTERKANGEERKIGFSPKNKLLTRYEFLDNLCNQNSYKSGPWDKIYLKKIIDENNLLFDEKIHYGEDLLFIAQYADLCERFYYESDEYLYVYNRIEESITQKNFSKKKASFIDICEELIKIYEKNNVDSCKIKKDYITYYYWALNFLNDNDYSKDEYKKICKKYSGGILKSKKLNFFGKMKIIGMIYFPRTMKLIKNIREGVKK